MFFNYFKYFRTAIEGLWIELFKLDSEKIITDERKRRISIVTIWFMLSLVIALFIPNISIVIRYLGALAGTFMFIFPGKFNFKNGFKLQYFNIFF